MLSHTDDLKIELFIKINKAKIVNNKFRDTHLTFFDKENRINHFLENELLV